MNIYKVPRMESPSWSGIAQHDKLSRPQRFQKHYQEQLKAIHKQAAVLGDDGHIIGYLGNTTGERSRKRIRALAREMARQAMRAESGRA